VLDVEFDRFAAEYEEAHAASIKLSGEQPVYFHRYKIADLATEVAAANIKPERILDFGGGVGNSLPFMRSAFPQAEIVCLDPSRRSLEIAERRFPGLASFQDFDGENIPFGDGVFDVAFTACVFHHIPEAMHQRLLGEIERVLRKPGMFLLYEHNPLNPLTRNAVKNCVFDENAVLIRASEMRQRILSSGFVRAGVRYRVFFPRMLSALRPMERALKSIPLGAQYYVSALNTER
jgi:ubiquinone/menaquinone biosynthesis C-methylase UbiE